MNTTIFIVESSAYSAEMLADTLKVFKYIPVIFDARKDLAVQLLETDPHMVIINRRIFEKSKQVFDSLKRREHERFDACLIITSSDLIDPQEVRKMEVDYFLHKPYDMKVLSTLLQRVESGKCRSETNFPQNPAANLIQGVHTRQSGTPLTNFEIGIKMFDNTIKSVPSFLNIIASTVSSSLVSDIMKKNYWQSHMSRLKQLIRE